jgi:anti-sigma B factor antagonist
MPEVLSQRKDDVLIGTFTSQKILEDTLIAQVRRELLDMADRAEGKMLLDFQGVTFMSSSMIGSIVLLNKKCRGRTEIRMCNISPSVMEVFEITRLDKILKICGSLEQALNDLASLPERERAVPA